MGLFSSADDSCLGIDIGDSSLKMVELKKKGRRLVLANYAFTENVTGIQFTKLEDADYLAKLINRVRDEVGIKARRAAVSLPTFAVFSSIINIANADKKTLPNLVREEAKKVIPLPLEEMILDWKEIPASENEKNRLNTKVFLTGSPKKLVRRYIEIFSKAKLELASLETETFSLIRCLLGNDPDTVMIVEIGANSTDLAIVKESIPVLSRSLEICGRTITEAIAKGLDVPVEQAEQFKLDLSLASKIGEMVDLPPAVMAAIAPIASEIEYMLDFYGTNYQGKVEKIILSGGSALMFGFSEYLSRRLNTQVIVGDPWARVDYPAELKGVITEVGPKLAVAIGLAMREIN